MLGNFLPLRLITENALGRRSSTFKFGIYPILVFTKCWVLAKQRLLFPKLNLPNPLIFDQTPVVILVSDYNSNWVDQDFARDFSGPF